MSVFYLSSGEVLVEITERRWEATPPLSYFCRVAADVARLTLAGKHAEVPGFVLGVLEKLLREGYYLKNHFCYTKIIEGIANFMVGRLASATRALTEALEIDPSNIMTISFLADISSNREYMVRRANVRIDEIITWQGHEDVLVVGDSHAYTFTGVGRCRPCYVGSHTMHRVGRDGLSFPAYREINISKYKIIAFSFGEIDARTHIARQSEKNNVGFGATIHDVVDRYIYAIKKEFEGNQSPIVAIIGIVPPIKKEMSKEGWFYGGDSDRLSITLELNAYLENKCRENQLVFVDMYSGFSDSSGFISTNFWFGDHHVSAKHYRELERRLMSAVDGSGEL